MYITTLSDTSSDWAKISDVALDVKVSLGSYVGVFIDIEDAAFKTCHSTMMRNSSRVILTIPRLSGVDNGEYRRRVIYRVARGLGRARSHPSFGNVFQGHTQLAPGRSAPAISMMVSPQPALFVFEGDPCPDSVHCKQLSHTIQPT